MRRTILSTLAAIAVFGAVSVTAAPAEARCWWNGWNWQCWHRPHHGWYGRHHDRDWWRHREGWYWRHDRDRDYYRGHRG